MKKELEFIKALLSSKVDRFHKGLCKQCYYTEKVSVLFDVQNGMFTLTESSSAILNRVNIRGLSPDTIVLRPENFGIRFYEKHTYNKACDYLFLTYDAQGKSHAVFIDIKTDIFDSPDSSTGLLRTNTTRDAECGMQFCGAQALFKLLSYMVKSVSKCDALSKYCEHYWVLYKNALNGEGVLGAIPEVANEDPAVVKAFRKSSLRDRIYTRETKNNEIIDFSSLC